MHAYGGAEKGVIKPDFNRSVQIDFKGAKLTSDAGVLMLREIDERFDIIGPMEDDIDDSRSARHTRHSIVQMIRQRVYQIAAGYEDCNDADHLRIDPALRLAIDKGHDPGAGQSMLSRLENNILGNALGLASLDEALLRSSDVILWNQDKRRIIIDLDSTEDPAYGDQEHVAYNGHFGKNCFHPLFCFTSDGACLGSVLRPGNVHSAHGSVDFIKPIVERYRPWFQLFWLRGDAAFADPDLYEYCEDNRITYFIRLRANNVLYDMIEPYLTRPVGRPPKSGVQKRIIAFHYQAQSWSRKRRVICKIEWHAGELFPRVGFIVSNSKLTAEEIVQVYNGRAEIENRIKEGKNTLRWDKTSCHRFDANHARLKMGVLAYNLLHIIRVFYLYGEEVRRSMEWLIRRLIKVAAKVAYHSKRWHIHIATAFPLAHHYRAVLGYG